MEAKSENEFKLLNKGYVIRTFVSIGKDGENIVIFDDSDDSDSEDIISDDEENEREMVSTQRDMKTEGDVVQSSLRSYISMAKLYCPDHLSFDSNQVSYKCFKCILTFSF